MDNSIKTALRKMGNSQGVLIPKTIIAQLGIIDDLSMTVEGDSIVLRKPPRQLREGWAQASKEIAEKGDDALIWPEFANSEDAELQW